MTRMGYEKAIIAKLRSEGCELDEAGCTPASLAFIKGKHAFYIPREPDSGYQPSQMEFIHHQTEYLGIDLLPLELWMH